MKPNPLNLLSGIFGGAVSLRNSLYDSGSLASHTLSRPVVSVGNLSVGGTGKTPFIILLGELLQQRGISFDVLSRGYGRATANLTLAVDPAGSPAQFGDEPLLIARRLRAPVFIGADRYRAGQLAEQHSPASQLHLLDDGFQHRRLRRCFDIVLVTPNDLRDRLLPAGRLREPLSALRRAHAIVLAAGADLADITRALDSPQPRSFPSPSTANSDIPRTLDSPHSHSAPSPPLIWRVRRGVIPPRDLPQQPVAFCGIARPQSFLLQLRTAGIEPVAEATYRDHHLYTAADIRDLLDLRQKSGAGGFVTTEKDAINLAGHLPALAPISIIPVKMSLEDSQQALDSILSAAGLLPPADF